MTISKAAALAIAGAQFMTCTAALAAAPDQPADDAAKREIVVSIKKPETDRLAYAGSATRIAGDALADRHVQDISTLSYAAPNASLDPIGTFKGVANFSIRGLGVNSSIPSIDPAVGLFVDGVYMGTNAGTVFDLLDVDSVDVLRGPQGVAFGRNTTGGAVLIATADPSFTWTGHAAMTFEGPVDKGRGAPMMTARAVVSGPLSDKVAFRAGILHSSDGGYFRNEYNNADFGKQETTTARLGLTLRASDALTFTLKGELTNSNGDGAATHGNGLFARDTFNMSVNQTGYNHTRNRFAVLRTKYELGTGTITNIAGWRKFRQDTRNDIDSTPLSLFQSDTGTRQEQWSDELFYAADFKATRITVGAYAFHQKIAYLETRDLSGLGYSNSYGGGREKDDLLGLYGQVDHDLSRTVTLSAGLRWSWEKKDAAITYVVARAACSTLDGSCPVSGILPGTTQHNGFADSHSWSNLSPRVALTWRAASDASVYASWTRGYRSGGYNLRITQPDAFEQVSAAIGSPAFGDERVDSYEAGIKLRTPDGRAHLNAALFWMDVRNLQREINVPSQTAGLAQSVYNTADARIRGVELDGEVALTGSLKLTGNLGYLDARYTHVFYDISGDGAIGAADLALDLPRAPQWTWGAGAQWSAPVSGKATLHAQVNFEHRSKYAYTDNNWGFNDASNRLDASVGVNLGEPNVTISIFGRNLLDEVQFGGDTQLPFGSGPNSDGVNRPYDPHPAAGTFSPMLKGRTVGLEAAMSF